MFTGIVSSIGTIAQVEPQSQSDERAGVRVRIQVRDFPLNQAKLGDSIAVQGACMTAVELGADYFVIDISRESLDRTTGLDMPGEVNLEHSLRLGDSLDGHLVSGHVDGVGRVAHFAPAGESWDLRIDAPLALAPYLAYKGSVAVNGVSLTVNRVEDHADGCIFHINLIPHTVQVTTLKHLKEGSAVNLEIDMIARYVDRMAAFRQLK